MTSQEKHAIEVLGRLVRAHGGPAHDAALDVLRDHMKSHAIVITQADIDAYLARPVEPCHISTTSRRGVCGLSEEHPATTALTWDCGCVYYYCDAGARHMQEPPGTISCRGTGNTRGIATHPERTVFLARSERID